MGKLLREKVYFILINHKEVKELSLLLKTAAKPEVKVLLELIKYYNLETYKHSISVATLTDKMLELTDYSEEEKEEIVTGALLHDIGKIFVPLNLIQIPQSLSLQEYNIVKVHAPVSYAIVKSVFSKTVQNICLYHHEKPNGSGYMDNMTLYNIPKEALLVQVADVFDALTSERIYKKCYTEEEAFVLMKEESQKFLLDDQYVKLLSEAIYNEKKEDLSNDDI